MSETFEFRGHANVWGRTFHTNATWFGARCAITAEAITVRALGREHVHRKEDLVELRWTWLPFPGFVAVSRRGPASCWSGFSTLRWSRLQQALAATGHSFTSQVRWPAWRQSRRDIRAYGLYDAAS